MGWDDVGSSTNSTVKEGTTLAGGVSENHYVSPYANRGTNIWHNAGEDVKDMVRGGATMAAMANLRLREGMLDQVRNVTPMPAWKQALTAHGAAPFLRPSDLPQMGQAAKGMFDYYKGEYYDPASSPNPAAPPNAPLGSAILHGIRQAPIARLFDAMPLAGPAFEGLGAAGRMAAATRPGQAIIKGAVTPAMEAMPGIVQSSGMVPDALRKLTPKGQAGMAADASRKALEDQDALYARQLSEEKQNINKGFRKLSGPERKLVTPLSEQTDYALNKKYGNQEPWKTALDTIEDQNKKQRDMMHIPDEVAKRQANIPRYLQQQENARRMRQYDLLKQYGTAAPEAKAGLKEQIKLNSRKLRAGDIKDPDDLTHQQGLDKIAAKHGRQPGHLPIDFPGRVAAGIHKAEHTVLGGGTKVAAKTATGEVGYAGDLSKSELRKGGGANLIEREATKARSLKMEGEDRKIRGVRGPEHELDASKLTYSSTAKAVRYHHTEQLIKKLMAIAPKEAPTKLGWEQVDLQKEFEQAAKEAGVKQAGGQVPNLGQERSLDAPTRMRAAPGLEPATSNIGKERFVSLPKPLAKLLRESIHGRGEMPYGLEHVENWNKAFKQGLFKYDPTFPVRLARQTFGLQLSTMRNPKDFVAMTVAGFIAKHPEADNVLPAAIMMTHSGAPDVHLLEAGASFKKAIEGYGQAGYDFHNWQRRSAAIDEILYRSNGADRSLKTMIGDMMDVSAALERAKAGLAKPGEIAALQEKLKPFGNYSNMASLRRRGIGLFFPVANWAAHARDMIATLPIRYPFKASLYHSFSAFGPDQFDANDYGKVPIKDDQGKIMKGPNGRTMFYSGPHMDVLETGLKQMTTLGNLAFPTGQGFEAGSPASPAINTYADMTRDANSFGMPFGKMNPDVKQVWQNGKPVYVNKKTGEAASTAAPAMALDIANNTFPKQMDAIRKTTMAMDAARRGGPMYEPSIYTYPGHPAPMLKRGIPQKADAIETALSLIGEGAREGQSAVKRKAGYIK